jgi:hypothetical protein
MNDQSTSQSFSSLPRSKKVAVVSLSFLALGVLGVWFWQFDNRLTNPFKPTDAEVAAANETAKEKAAADEAAKTKDTDGDGLSDYDEINVYKTSPYLEDTDGDGISDYDEVKRGTDPLCKEGSDCSLASAQKDALASTTASSTAGISTSASSTTATGPASNVDQSLLIKALNGQGDASTMRQILIQGGADADQVKLLSDSDLMEMYQDVLGAQNPSALSSSTASSTGNKQ